MIKLIKNGKIKTISDMSYELMKEDLQGWELVSEKVAPFSKPFEKPIEAQKFEKHEPVLEEKPIDEISKGEEKARLSRQEMIEYLKSKGVSCNPRISDQKLIERYELEINT